MKRLLALAAALLGAVSCSSLEPPELISPQEGEILLTATPRFTWHPTPDTRSYLVEVSADQAFSEVTDTLLFSDTSFVLADTLDLGRDYYWRVSSRSMQGQQSEPSLAGDFTVEQGVRLVEPGPHDSIRNSSFQWETYPGASAYRFSLSSYADFRKSVADTMVPATTYEPSDILELATYFWKVQAFDSEGKAISSPSLVYRLVTYELKDTYFPLYEGRMQAFEMDSGGGSYDPHPESTWVDTARWEQAEVEIEVESTFVDDEDVLFWVLSDTFWDVGSVFGLRHDSLYGPHFFLSLMYPEEGGEKFRIWSDTMFSVQYRAETLNVYRQEGDSGNAFFKHVRIKRLPGKGVVEQYYREENIVNPDLHSWKVIHLYSP